MQTIPSCTFIITVTILADYQIPYECLYDMQWRMDQNFLQLNFDKDEIIMNAHTPIVKTAFKYIFLGYLILMPVCKHLEFYFDSSVLPLCSFLGSLLQPTGSLKSFINRLQRVQTSAARLWVDAFQSYKILSLYFPFSQTVFLADLWLLPVSHVLVCCPDTITTINKDCEFCPQSLTVDSLHGQYG